MQMWFRLLQMMRINMDQYELHVIQINTSSFLEAKITKSEHQCASDAFSFSFSPANLSYWWGSRNLYETEPSKLHRELRCINKNDTDNIYGAEYRGLEVFDSYSILNRGPGLLGRGGIWIVLFMGARCLSMQNFNRKTLVF